MLKKIESIRKKPKEVRNVYAFWIAFSITMVIASFWVASISSQLAILQHTPTPGKEKIEKGSTRWLSSLKASLFESIQPKKDVALPVQTTSSENSAEKTPEDIDFSTFFTSSTTQESSEYSSSSARRVLIGTSSASTGSASVPAP